MSIASEITRINNNIANAYTQCSNKGATMPATQNSDNLANTISTISGGGGADLNDYFNRTIDSVSTSSSVWGNDLLKKVPELTIGSGITSLEYSFYNCTFPHLIFEKIDCINITSLLYMFGCSSTSYSYLKTLDISNFTNTQNITNFQDLFVANSKLESLIGIKELLTLNRTVNTSYLFHTCEKLTHLDLSGFNPASGSIGTQMFRSTYKLATLDISSMDLNNITKSNMFQYCGRDCLQSDGAYADGIPYVYVKDQSQQSALLSASGIGRPSSWSTNNVVIKSS